MLASILHDIGIAALALEPARRRGVQPTRAGLEAIMAAARRLPFATLGWQTWSFIVVVLVIMLASAAFVMFSW
jgi:hypothetical protein